MTEQVDDKAPEQTYEADQLPINPLDAIQDGLRRQLDVLADNDMLSPEAYRDLLPVLLDATEMAFTAGQAIGIPPKGNAERTVAMKAGKTIVAGSRSD